MLDIFLIPTPDHRKTNNSSFASLDPKLLNWLRNIIINEYYSQIILFMKYSFVKFS